MTINKVTITPTGNTVVELKGAELEEYNTNIAAVETFRQAIETAETAKATAQASGNTKLLDLGLTQEEATALTGYSIPVVEEEE